jgi:hypothetical protein
MRQIAAVLVALALAGGALAYVATGGSGRGSSAGGSSQQLTVEAGAPAAALHPGGSADVAAVLRNPNPASVHVGSLALDGSQGTGGYDVDPVRAAAGCSVESADLHFATQTDGWVVPPRTGGTDGQLTVHLPISMGTDSASACQDASFTVYLKAGS